MKTLEQMIEAAKAVMDEYDLVNYPHEFAADFALEQIEEVIAAERSRIYKAAEYLRAFAYCENDCPDGCECCITLFDEEDGFVTLIEAERKQAAVLAVVKGDTE